MDSPALRGSRAERDRWVLSLRPDRHSLDPWRAYGAFVEPERGPDGSEAPTATLLLTNRECPYRCVMCDLWRNTLSERTPAGAIVRQIRDALAALPPARVVKLYNAGSFFDPGAIPPEEYPAIAELMAPFQRVVVECHPALVGERTWRFQTLLAERGTALEVAMGLETVHPEVLARLNKQMTVAQFRTAARRLQEREVALRVFLLLRPPWLSEAEGVFWAERSLDEAFACGAGVCSVIPTRAGNGAMEALAREGAFVPPRLHSLEAVCDYGLGLRAGRVFADLWDVDPARDCPDCGPVRVARLRERNRTQEISVSLLCSGCESNENRL